MLNIKTILTDCIKEVGREISESEYLIYLLENKHKFEGWFQVELAKRLNVKSDDFGIPEILVEHKTEKGFYVDVFIRNKDKQDMAVEIKFIVKNRGITKSRESLLDQMSNNFKSLKSFGVAVLVSKDGEKWFQDELKRIKGYCKEKKYQIKTDSADYKDKLFCIKLLQHE